MNFLGLLAILFIALKLTAIITWSWWWVLLPLYLIPAFFLAGAVVTFFAVWANEYRKIKAARKRRLGDG